MRGAASREELISRDSQQSLISLKEDPQVETVDAHNGASYKDMVQ